jgi:peptide/nickel transport system permease protein/peptide/nickel transport system substrate-binding protein
LADTTSSIARRRFVAGAGGLALTIAAARNAGAEARGLLRVSANVNPSTLDPMTGRSGGDHQFLYPLYDTLVQWQPQTGEPRPGLARAWTYKDDTTLVLELRPGLTFHDGTPLDAEAVKFNFDRNRQDQRSNIKVDLSSVDSVEASGPTTVTVRLKASDRSLPLILSDRAGMMVSPAAVKASENGTLDRKPVGAGPWKYVTWEDNTIVSYAHNPSYWDKAIPKIDKIDMRIIPEVATGVRSMLAGESDMVVAVPPVQRPVLQRSGKVTVFTNPSLYLHMVYLDYSRPPLDDVRVRRALNLAVDRTAFNSAAMSGLGEPATTLFPKDYWPHDAALGGLLAYDPDKAKALVKEVGGNLTVSCFTYSDQAAIQRGELLNEMWQRVGIKSKMRSATVPEASASFFGQRATDMFLAALTSRPDPSMGCFILFDKASFYNGGHQEIAGMQAALAESRSGTTQEQRKAALSKVQRIACEQALFLPLVFDASVIGVAKKFTGFQPNIFGRPRYETLAAAPG